MNYFIGEDSLPSANETSTYNNTYSYNWERGLSSYSTDKSNSNGYAIDTSGGALSDVVLYDYIVEDSATAYKQ